MVTKRAAGRSARWPLIAGIEGVAVIALAAAALLAAACEEGGDEAAATPPAGIGTIIASATAVVPAATPTPLPTPEAAACPDDDPAFCAFAVQAEQAIANEDADFFVANTLTESILCTAEAADVGYLCGAEQIGETITGVPYGREASEGTLVPPDDYHDFWVQLFASDLPEEEDTEGSGELRIWGLGYPVLPAEGSPRSMVVTYISDAGLGLERQAISLRCELTDGQWQIKSLLQHLLGLASPQDTYTEWRGWPE